MSTEDDGKAVILEGKLKKYTNMISGYKTRLLQLRDDGVLTY